MKRRDFTGGSLVNQFYFSAASSILEAPCQGNLGGDILALIVHSHWTPLKSKWLLPPAKN